MKEQVTKAIDEVVHSFKMVVSDVYVEKEEGNTFLKIELDSDEIIDLNRITEVSQKINPIIDQLDLLEGEYILDIYAKEKGEVNNE